MCNKEELIKGHKDRHGAVEMVLVVNCGKLAHRMAFS